MKNDYRVRHPRLDAFYNSKLLNGLMIGMILCLFIMDHIYWVTLPVVACLILLVGVIGYSLWFWIKKPSSIIVNSVIANVSSFYTLYFLIVTAMHSIGKWWYIFGVAAGVAGLGMLFVKKNDSEYEIKSAASN